MKDNLDFYNIPIVDYLLSIGEPLEKIGHNYYQHMEHDSLKINVKKNYFVWNSRLSEKNAKGGVVQYLQIVRNYSLKEALKKIDEDLNGKKLTLKQVKKAHYPNNFIYKVKEVSVPLEAQKYLVFERKIPNTIVKYFFSIGLIQQNENSEIVFKWYKGSEVVGFSKQGTKKLSDEEKEKYHTKRDYFKYVAPTTEIDTYWGFNYLKGEPQNIYFFESSIDLLSYYAGNEYELEKSNDFWLISIDGLAKEKVFSFLKYGTENYNLKNILKTLNVCFDNDKAGETALRDLQCILVADKPFQDKRPKTAKDWNEWLQLEYKKTKEKIK